MLTRHKARVAHPTWRGGLIQPQFENCTPVAKVSSIPVSGRGQAWQIVLAHFRLLAAKFAGAKARAATRNQPAIGESQLRHLYPSRIPNEGIRAGCSAEDRVSHQAWLRRVALIAHA